MPNFDEGYIKYSIRYEPAPAPEADCLPGLISVRNGLKNTGLIGNYSDGTGYGNISCRGNNENTFIISGTQTGHKLIADASDFSMVIDYDIAKNELFCRGPVKASSEALTHAALYHADPDINSVIHVHHVNAWKNFLNEVTTVGSDIQYGTVEMATEIAGLLKSDRQLSIKKIFVTAGHRDGIFAFGNSLDETYRRLLDVISKIK